MENLKKIIKETENFNEFMKKVEDISDDYDFFTEDYFEDILNKFLNKFKYIVIYEKERKSDEYIFKAALYLLNISDYRYANVATLNQFNLCFKSVKSQTIYTKNDHGEYNINLFYDLEDAEKFCEEFLKNKNNCYFAKFKDEREYSETYTIDNSFENNNELEVIKYIKKN